MRFSPVLLGIFALALLTDCSSELNVPHLRPAERPQVLTGVTEYYRRGSNPSPSPLTTPLPATRVSTMSAKPNVWARITGLRATGPSHAKSSTVTQYPITHGPVFANPDGTTSKVVGNALIRSDGTRGNMIGNTVYHANGTISRIVGDTLVNPDGSQSRRINDQP
jgi:hypothetical protein